MECYRHDPLTKELREGSLAKQFGKSFDNIFHYSGWHKVGPFNSSETIKSGYSWWTYTIVAPKYVSLGFKLPVICFSRGILPVPAEHHVMFIAESCVAGWLPADNSCQQLPTAAL
jgi:hypothetical protein